MELAISSIWAPASIIYSLYKLYLSSISKLQDIQARIFFSLIAIFFISFIQKYCIQRLSVNTNHLVNAVIGLASLYYCIGISILHPLGDFIVIAIILKLLPGSFISLVLTWVLVISHLQWGYYLIVIDSDQIRTLYWTLPCCVLTLKLIGLATDMYQTANIKHNTESPLTSTNISIIELFGYSFFFPTCIVGPQIRFQRYKDFVEGRLYDKTFTPSSNSAALQRFLLGIVSGIFYVSLEQYVPLYYYTSEDFAMQNMSHKLAYSMLRHFIALKQYYIIWLFSEAACIVTGVSYVGAETNEQGKTNIDWSACTGIHVLKLEFAYYTYAYIEAFNASTNEWAFHYIYKNLKFLRSKLLSQFFTLLFISAWHGFYVGYYISSFCQIPVFFVEKTLTHHLNRYLTPLSKWEFPLRLCAYCFGYVYRYFAISIPFIIFQLQTLEKCYTYGKSMYIYFLAYLMLVFVCVLLNLMEFRRPRKLKTK